MRGSPDPSKQMRRDPDVQAAMDAVRMHFQVLGWEATQTPGRREVKVRDPLQETVQSWPRASIRFVDHETVTVDKHGPSGLRLPLWRAVAEVEAKLRVDRDA